MMNRLFWVLWSIWASWWAVALAADKEAASGGGTALVFGLILAPVVLMRLARYIRHGY